MKRRKPKMRTTTIAKKGRRAEENYFHSPKEENFEGGVVRM